MKIILDVDPGIDDAIAIALAHKWPGIEILGITTVGGNLPLEKTTDNGGKILKLLGANYKVYPGMAQPLIRELKTAENIHGPTGLGYAQLPEGKEYIADKHGVDFIIEQVNKYPKEITLIGVGPLTNIATAIKKDPSLPQKVRGICVMGGAVFTQGNVTPAAEFNIYVDPESAEIVFNCGAEIILVGLDVTLKVLLTREHLEIIQKKGGSLGESIGEMTKFYLERYLDGNKLPGCALHDPLAVAVALDKSLVSMEKMYVGVETKGELTRGATIGDKLSRFNKKPNVYVCTQVDSNRFLELFLDRILDHTN
ncbi:purine nucleosidase [Anaerobranca californiensis DSM 14826]|jgi:inosine-uridine nucleoside N-ribohydrolase|uniref:Purine nucleosidase n=1 Tax=Anaerobranca californiensis DSM 14826 TaxID=1120989 RepID=A0A1M6Q8V0_9FIRM|nr:nucleoside hydrolase [Anaerobranca californiensis]SHK16621.1 purine nucleosidase [Anaerobranca californiensis DSM 14826]